MEVPLFFRFRGAVIWSIWFEVCLCTLYAAGMVFLHCNYPWEVELPSNVLSVLGVATGMLLVFRTNTSYDRFWEGRKRWSELTTSIRTLIRTFWIMIDDQNNTKVILEKLTIVNLLVAFAYSTKHYLREEYSFEEGDLLALAGQLPHLLTPSSTDTLDAQEKVWIQLAAEAAKKRKMSVDGNGDKLDNLETSVGKTKKKNSHPSSLLAKTNIPLEITYYLSSFAKACRDKNIIDSSTCRIIDTGIDRLIDSLTAFERIRRTQIPIAYRVHLAHVTWIVLLMLPFHWSASLKWLTVPLMTVTSFAMLGILGIGCEIEEPFGYDYNDLDLDDFCRLIHKEAIAITSQPMPPHESWIFSEQNHPIISDPSFNALELAKLSPNELRKVMWKGKQFTFSERSIKSHGSTANRAKSKSKQIDKNDLSNKV